MEHPEKVLTDFEKSCDFMVGVDSDGCAFDSMDFKHNECFAPAVINVFDLQPYAKYAREVWSFVNLYSKTRGLNRFPALVRFFELLSQRPEVQARGFVMPDLTDLREWIAGEKVLGNPSLARAIEKNPSPILKQALAWSEEVNANVRKMSRNIPPFPYAREALAKAHAGADVLVVSATPTEAIAKEWAANQIDQYLKVIAGQEMGTKSVHLSLAKKGRYADDHMIMVGDAPGDMKSAKENHILFYPINPGDEETSWKRFYEEALDLFFAGKYAGEYEAARIAEFEACLPELPPWEVENA